MMLGAEPVNKRKIDMDNFNNSEQIAMGVLLQAASKRLYGLEIVDKSDNALKRGTVYITLSRLEERGFVESENEPAPKGSIPRRMYRVTGSGQRAFSAWQIGRAAQQAAFDGWGQGEGANYGS
jgi:DNA-binding PadR family transcriptional regulator